MRLVSGDNGGHSLHEPRMQIKSFSITIWTQLLVINMLHIHKRESVGHASMSQSQKVIVWFRVFCNH